ncbi:mechanosensitive ion channel family protein [Sphingosinicella terrae]|uniref:mechanosensitive ion channel family protein n=1 Tax=Sphingosinicella terrae TaxID=2172047 RepID=UPI000E0CE8BB|nr:mechanosensitive ion channel family protein [Sphingosinicella terrae]
MTNRSAGAGAPALDLSEQTETIVQESTAWLTGHSLDIAIAGAAGLGVALVLFGIRTLGCRLIAGGSAELKWRIVFARVLARTRPYFIAATSAALVAEIAETPPTILRLIQILFVVASAFQAAIWGRELILGYVEHKVGAEPDQSNLGSAVGIIRLLVTVALFAIAVIVILDNLGINVTGLVAGLGIGGIAIGLAAQGIFSDLFAALSIIFDRPFRRGDSITFGTTTGTVEQIGLKTTRVRSLTGEEVVISNAKLLDQQLQNWTLLQRRRVVMHFGVVYQVTPDMLAQIPEELKAIVERQPLASFDRAHAFQFGDSSIDFELVFHVETPDYTEFMTVRQGIMLDMMRRFAELGVDFAYPTQTTFTAAPDGKLVMPYPHVRMLAEADGEEGSSEPR